jgi:hypothetical protein
MWTAAQALSVATFPRELGQERFVARWWRAPAGQRERVAGQVMALIEAVQRRGALDRLGIGGAETALWGEMAPRATELSEAPLAGGDALCAPPPVVGVKGGKPAPGPAAYGLGDRVAHAHFGQGEVVGIESVRNGKGSDWHVTVRFSGGKLVKLLAGIAPLTRLG